MSSIELTLLILIGCTAFCDANDTLDANIFTCVLSNICQLSPCQNGGNCTHVSAPSNYTCDCNNDYQGINCSDCKWHYMHMYICIILLVYF